jgi:hypothetical protein
VLVPVGQATAKGMDARNKSGGDVSRKGACEPISRFGDTGPVCHAGVVGAG